MDEGKDGTGGGGNLRNCSRFLGIEMMCNQSDLIKFRVITHPFEEIVKCVSFVYLLTVEMQYIKMNKNNRQFQPVSSTTPSDRMRRF